MSQDDLPAVSFPSSSSLLPTPRPLSMPKDSKTGKLLLKAVKREQADRLAARTAAAIDQCQSSSVDVSDNLGEGQDTEAPVSSGGQLWTRHDIDAGKLLVFARGDEIITIRKSPEGPGWYIDYDGPVENRSL